MTSSAEQIEQAILALEAQREVLGDLVVETALRPLRDKLTALRTRPAGERKQVTILFATVRGLDQLETTDAEELNRVLNMLWERLDRAVKGQGGIVDKHVETRLMALFGAPAVHEDDPHRAIRAALAMRTALASLTPSDLAAAGVRLPPVTGGKPLTLSIGINTGQVMLGELGATAEYTAMGDAVNVASRLEEAAGPDRILISQASYRHVRGFFEVEPLDPIQPRGKANPLRVYRVNSEKPRAFPVAPRPVAGRETATVGRERELEQLKIALEAVVQRGRPGVVVVSGEAGVGKTRLLHEFLHWMLLMPERVWLFRAEAEALSAGLPYAVAHDLVAFRFEIRDSDPVSVARHKLEKGVGRFLGKEALEKAHFIGHLIGIDFSESPYLKGILNDPRQIQAQAFHYLAQLLRAMAAEQPVVLFLENGQWLDSGSLDLITYLLGECRDQPLLFLIMARPAFFERFPDWWEGSALSPKDSLFWQLALQPLEMDESQRLLKQILEAMPVIPERLQRLVVERAAGNPFYLEELVKMLIDDGVILAEGQQWDVRLDRLVPDRVPPTLLGVLQARLDGLTAVERAVLQRAAVIGQTFWLEAIHHLHGERQDDEEQRDRVEKALQVLVKKEIIFRQERSTFLGTTEYAFKHGLFHSVTYESVLLRQRAVYHAAVADWLRGQTGERAGELAGLIAGHYERAAARDQAAFWYQRAGERARAAYLPEAATLYFEKALAYLPVDESSLADKIALYRALGEMLARQARRSETRVAYEAMREAAHKAGDLVAETQALTLLAQVERRLGHTRTALVYVQEAERVALEAGAGAAAGLMRALAIQSWCTYTLGDVEDSLELGERALVLSREKGEREEEALTLTVLGIIHEAQGYYGAASDYKQQALEVYKQMGNRWGVGVAYNNLGENARAQGDYAGALNYYEQALQIAQETGNRESQLSCYNNIGAARVGLGEYKAALESLQQLLQLNGAHAWFALSETYRFLAESFLGLERWEEAREAALRALELGVEREQQDFIGAAWRVLAGVAATGLPVKIEDVAYDAVECFRRSDSIFEKAGRATERAITLQKWGEYEQEQGRITQGEQLLTEARAIFNSLGLEEVGANHS